MFEGKQPCLNEAVSAWVFQKNDEGAVRSYRKLWSGQLHYLGYSGMLDSFSFFRALCSFFVIILYPPLPPFQDKESVGNLVKLIDKSNGYIFAGIEGSAVEYSKIAAAPIDWDYYRYPFSDLNNCAMFLFCLFIPIIQLAFKRLLYMHISMANSNISLIISPSWLNLANQWALVFHRFWDSFKWCKRRKVALALSGF